MKVLSLKVHEEIFEEAEKVTHQMKIKRNAYINQALDFYNKLMRRKLLKKQFQKASRLVRASSLEVLHEFEMLQDDLP